MEPGDVDDTVKEKFGVKDEEEGSDEAKPPELSDAERARRRRLDAKADAPSP